MVKKFVKVLVGGLEKRIYPKDISKVHRKKVKNLHKIPEYDRNKKIDSETENSIENCHIFY
jgi:hypothetical protein